MFRLKYLKSMAIKPSVSKIFLTALIAWGLASTVLGRFFTAISLDGFDAAFFAYVGEKWLEGSIPYVDIWDIKPPGIFFVNAFVFWLGLNSFTVLAVIEGIFIIGCITTIYAIMRQFGAPVHSIFLATTACAVMANLEYFNGHGNLTEIYVLWPTALSMLMFARALPDFRSGQLILAGFFAGIATSFKLIGLAPFLAQLTFLVLGAILGRWSIRSFLFFVAISMAGFAIAWLPWLAYFSWHSSLLELLGVSFAYPFLYGAENQDSLFSVPFTLVERLHPVGSLAVTACIGIGLLAPCMYKILSRPLSALDLDIPGKWIGGWAALSALWLFFDIAGALAGGRGYQHYFLALSGSLPVMVGVSYWHVIEHMTTRIENGEVVRGFVVCVILSSALLSQTLDIRKLRHEIQKPTRTHPITEYINNNKEKKSTLFVWSYFPRFYFETGLKSPYKIVAGDFLRISSYTRKVFAKHLMPALEAEAPTFIILDAANMSSDDVLFKIYKRLQVLVDKKYEFVREVEVSNLHLYRRRVSSASVDG